MPSLFETIGVVVVAGTTAAVSVPEGSAPATSQILVAAIALVLCAATFLGFRVVWVRSKFDDPPTPGQKMRGYLLYFGMPLCVLAVGIAVAFALPRVTVG